MLMCPDVDRRTYDVLRARTPLEQRAAQEMAAQNDPSPWSLGATPFVCRDWCNRCWHRWVRIRALEHLRGENYWEELDHRDFGLLRRDFHPNVALIREIERQLSTGDENLVVINRLVGEAWPLKDVADILSKIDLNGRRLPRFAFLPPRRSQC